MHSCGGVVLVAKVWHVVVATVCATLNCNLLALQLKLSQGRVSGRVDLQIDVCQPVCERDRDTTPKILSSKKHGVR